MATELTKQDLNDILCGATLLGAGGGGPHDLGVQFIEYIDDRTVTMIDADEMTDGKLAAISAGVGSPTAATHGFDNSVPTTAWKELNSLVENIGYVMPGEIGAANTLLPMTVCANLGLPLVDTTGARRAMPSLQMATFAADGVAPSPIVLGSGDQKLWFYEDDVPAADAALRGIITTGTFPGDAGMAFWSMPKSSVVNSGIQGTVQCARQVGVAIREAVANGQDPVPAVLRLFPGSREVFRGSIEEFNQEETGGFDIGTMRLKHASEDATLVVVNKNENLIAWRSDKEAPVVTAPDLIAYLCTDGTVFSNADVDRANGKTVAVLAIPATEEERKSKVVDAYLQALQQVGYYGPYRPLPGRSRRPSH